MRKVNGTRNGKFDGAAIPYWQDPGFLKYKAAKAKQGRLLPRPENCWECPLIRICQVSQESAPCKTAWRRLSKWRANK